MIIALFSWLSGSAGRYVALGAGVIAMVGAGWSVLAVHDRTVEAELVARQQVEAAAYERQLHKATVAAFGRLLADQEASADRDAQILKEIAHAPATTGCAGSPAVSAALRGLRNNGTGDGAGGHPDANAVMPTGAGTAEGPD